MAKTKRRQGGPRRLTKAQIAAMEARRRRDKRRRIVATVLIVAVIGGIVATLVVTAQEDEAEVAAPISAAADPSVVCTPDEKFDPITEGNGHVKKPTYEVNPPAGGNHLDRAAAPGIYSESKAPEDGKIVHSLEHGYVAIWYHPDVSEAHLARLENVWKNYKRDVLLVERRSLPPATPVVATAWHNRLVCTGGADDFQLNNFVLQFNNQGPEKVPHTVPPEGRKPRT